VLKRGLASGTIVSSGGQEIVSSGGTLARGIISAGGQVIVSGGGSASDTMVAGSGRCCPMAAPSGQRS
jgi:autotransporter passenger strand-loop-strand repeat protein